MRPLTTSEALEFLETTFNVGPEAICTGLIEATVAGTDVESATRDLESYLSIIASEIDPDTIRIRSDVVEGADMDAVSIHIKTRSDAE